MIAKEMTGTQGYFCLTMAYWKLSTGAIISIYLLLKNVATHHRLVMLQNSESWFKMYHYIDAWIVHFTL